jgi:hypothetical protein
MMDSKEILKAIDPKAAKITELELVVDDQAQIIKSLRSELMETRTDLGHLEWLKTNGVMLETPEGMRYLKDEEFEEFLNGLPKFSDSAIGRLAQAMQNTKDTLAAGILNNIFNEEYDKRSEELTKELINGADTRKKSKRSGNKNP